MSRDLVVFAPKEEPLSADEILGALRAEGIEAQWRTESPSRGSEVSWRRARVVLSGASEDEGVSVRTNPIRDAEREYLATVTGAGAHAKALAESRRQYYVGLKGAPSGNRRRLWETLARVIAVRADGVIHDPETESYHDAASYPRAGGGDRGSP